MKNLLKKSIKEYQEIQDLIYEVQKLSNKIRATSKQAIALLRRDNIKESGELIKEAETIFGLLNKIIKKNRSLKNQGFYREAVEEYIEALVLYNFLINPRSGLQEKIRGDKSNKEIPDFIEAGYEEIISGICDFTGELVRKAITDASQECFAKLLFYKETVENIAQDLAKISLRGKLRQKYDEVERNLSKMEGILYDIKLRKN